MSFSILTAQHPLLYAPAVLGLLSLQDGTWQYSSEALLLWSTGLFSDAGRRQVGPLEQLKVGKGQEASPGAFCPQKGSEQSSDALYSSVGRANVSAMTQAAATINSVAQIEKLIPENMQQQGTAMGGIAAPIGKLAKKSKEELEHAWQGKKEAALRKTGLLKFLNPTAPAYVPLNQAHSQPSVAVAATPPFPAVEHSSTDQTASAADLLLAQLMGSPVSAGGGIYTGEAII